MSNVREVTRAWAQDELRKSRRGRDRPAQWALEGVMKVTADLERLEVFAKWCWDQAGQGLDVDGGDVQEKLLELGFIEWRDVDPAENELGEERLLFWVDG